MDAYDRMRARYDGLDFVAVQAEADRIARRLAALCESAALSHLVSPAEYATLLPLGNAVRTYRSERHQAQQDNARRQRERLNLNVAIAARSPDTLETALSEDPTHAE